MSSPPTGGPVTGLDMSSISSIADSPNCETFSINTNRKALKPDHKGLSNFGMADVDAPTEYRDISAEDVKGGYDGRDLHISSTQSAVSEKAASTLHSIKAQSVTSTHDSHGAYPTTLRLTFIVFSLGLVFFLVALDKTIIATST